MTYIEAKDAFQQATPAGAKKCASIQNVTAETYLTHADHEIAEKDKFSGHLRAAIGITREKSLEAIKICQAPPKSPTPLTPPKIVTPPFFDTIYFDPNKTNNNLTAAMTKDRDGMILTGNPQIRLEIGGHSDSAGSNKVNQKVSKRRVLRSTSRINSTFRMIE